MTLRDRIKDEIDAAYSLGFIEGERRQRDRLTCEELSLPLHCPAGEKQPPPQRLSYS